MIIKMELFQYLNKTYKSITHKFNLNRLNFIHSKYTDDKHSNVNNITNIKVCL